jgi:hypothetical protein
VQVNDKQPQIDGDVEIAAIQAEYKKRMSRLFSEQQREVDALDRRFSDRRTAVRCWYIAALAEAQGDKGECK